MESIFQLSALLVVPFWLLMILLPKWQWTRMIMNSILVVVPAALLYAALIFGNLNSTLDFMGQLFPPSLVGVQTMLGMSVGATIAWIHFGAFDLFVGRWVYLDSLEGATSTWVVSPILVVVFLFGPVGLLLYLGARWIMGRNRSSAALG